MRDDGVSGTWEIFFLNAIFLNNFSFILWTYCHQAINTKRSLICPWVYQYVRCPCVRVAQEEMSRTKRPSLGAQDKPRIQRDHMSFRNRSRTISRRVRKCISFDTAQGLRFLNRMLVVFIETRLWTGHCGMMTWLVCGASASFCLTQSATLSLFSNMRLKVHLRPFHECCDLAVTFDES